MLLNGLMEYNTDLLLVFCWWIVVVISGFVAVWVWVGLKEGITRKELAFLALESSVFPFPNQSQETRDLHAPFLMVMLQVPSIGGSEGPSPYAPFYTFVVKQSGKNTIFDPPAQTAQPWRYSTVAQYDEN